MKLTQEQLNLVQQKLVIAKACPNCGYTEDKIVDPNSFELISNDIQNGSINFGGNMTYQPLLTVRCPKCSFTSLFNLKTLGGIINLIEAVIEPSLFITKPPLFNPYFFIDLRIFLLFF